MDEHFQLPEDPDEPRPEDQIGDAIMGNIVQHDGVAPSQESDPSPYAPDGMQVGGESLRNAPMSSQGQHQNDEGRWDIEKAETLAQTTQIDMTPAVYDTDLNRVGAGLAQQDKAITIDRKLSDEAFKEASKLWKEYLEFNEYGHNEHETPDEIHTHLTDDMQARGEVMSERFNKGIAPYEAMYDSDPERFKNMPTEEFMALAKTYKRTGSIPQETALITEATANPANSADELARLDRELDEVAYYEDLVSEDETDKEWIEDGPYWLIAKADEKVQQALANRGIQSTLPDAIRTAVFRQSGYVYIGDRLGGADDTVNLYVEPEIPIDSTNNEYSRRATICKFASDLSEMVQDRIIGATFSSSENKPEISTTISGIRSGFNDPVATYIEQVRDNNYITDDDKHRLMEAAREALGEERFARGMVTVQPPGFTLTNLEHEKLARIEREEKDRAVVERAMLDVLGADGEAVKRIAFDKFLTLTQTFQRSLRALDRLETAIEDGSLTAYKEMGMEQRDHLLYRQYHESVKLILRAAQNAGLLSTMQGEAFEAIITRYRTLAAEGQAE